ncbi:MAG TPA: class I SAM-dependent methyltransferase [Candidatus Eisenbacteria bacterium]|nr:class I SAM-dependent methyltransferase [Candidatus Eisenbacteria bacterium]
MSSTWPQFVGGVPAHYDRYLVPVIFDPYAVDLAERLTRVSGGEVLEIACGTGVVTQRLRQVLPRETALTATDLHEEMVEEARRRNPGPGVTWKVADGTALPFEDNRFDSVVCQFGVMFFPDKLAGMREARRVLRSSGRYVFNVWDSHAVNPFGRIAYDTITTLLPAGQPPFYDKPFSFCDEPAIRSLLRDAGFRSSAIERVPMRTSSPSAREFATGLVRGNPVILTIQECGLSDDEVISAIERELIREGGDLPYRSTSQALVVTAKV